MSTPPSILPTVDQSTQQQIDALKAEIAALQAQKAARTPWPLWTRFTTWLAGKHWTYKTALVAYATVAGVVAINPQAHASFLDLWAHVPKWAVDVAGVAGPLVAAVVSGNKALPDVTKE